MCQLIERSRALCTVHIICSFVLCLVSANRTQSCLVYRTYDTWIRVLFCVLVQLIERNRALCMHQVRVRVCFVLCLVSANRSATVFYLCTIRVFVLCLVSAYRAAQVGGQERGGHRVLRPRRVRALLPQRQDHRSPPWVSEKSNQIKPN